MYGTILENGFYDIWYGKVTRGIVAKTSAP